jgi:hypothetical protein
LEQCTSGEGIKTDPPEVWLHSPGRPQLRTPTSQQSMHRQIVHIQNADARRFYTRRGFQPLDEERVAWLV